MERVIGKTISDNGMFHLQAMNYAKTLTFKPAQKDGKPVNAWTAVQLKAIRNR